MNNFRILFFFCFFHIVSFGQASEQIIQKRLEFWMEKNQLENPDFTQIQENWEYYLVHPLNINKAKKEELELLDLLNELQINELILHREKLGDFLSIYELQTLETWDNQLIELVYPFLTMDGSENSAPLSWHALKKEGKLEGLTRYIHPIHSTETATNFVGSSDYCLTKIRYSYHNRLSIGFTCEKDIGEPFFKEVNKNGFDFYSGHFALKGGKFIKNVLLGDYHVQLGQGLNFWTSYAIGKSLDIVTIKKNAQLLRPHTSTEESRFLRGGAIEIGYKRCSILLFASHDQKDASSSDTNFVSSILLSGYHRSPSELERKDKMIESIVGCYLNYTRGTFHFGIASVYTHFNPLFSKPLKPYNVFDFRGEKMQSTSADYSFTFRNMLLFGEVSYVDFSKKTANLHGLLIALDHRVSLSFLYRNYDKSYETRYNAGFSETNAVQNENGLYAGIQIKPNSSWNIQAYSDFFQFPWLRYQVNAPSKGLENIAQLTYRPNKKLECYFRFRNQMKEINSVLLSTGSKSLVEQSQQNVRLNLDYQLTETIELHSRVELIRLERQDKPLENGSLFYQDIRYKPKSMPIVYTFRYLLFDTDSYASRMYAYEATPTYQYVCPAYFGKGNKAYLLVKYTLFSKFDFWIRLSATELLINRKNEINLQFRWRM